MMHEKWTLIRSSFHCIHNYGQVSTLMKGVTAKRSARRSMIDHEVIRISCDLAPTPFSLFSFSYKSGLVIDHRFAVTHGVSPDFHKKIEKRTGPGIHFLLSSRHFMNLCTLGGMKRKWRYAHSRTCCKFL